MPEDGAQYAVLLNDMTVLSERLLRNEEQMLKIMVMLSAIVEMLSAIKGDLGSGTDDSERHEC